MTLEGKTILITRARDQAKMFAERIRAEGGIPIIFPSIRILPPESWNACDEAIADLSRITGIFFTSANAVEFFVDRVRKKWGSVEPLQSLNVFAVGDSTAEKIRSCNIPISLIPGKFTGADLAAACTPEMAAGKRYLFPRGNLGGGILPKYIRAIGGTVDEVIVYRTVTPEPQDVAPICSLLASGKIDVITFTSPSTIKNFFRMAPEITAARRQPVFAVIGPVTASALEKMNRRPAIVAAPSTIEGLVNAIIAYFHHET